MKHLELHHAFTITGTLTSLATAATLITAHGAVFNDIPHGKEIVAFATGIAAILSAFGVSATAAKAPAAAPADNGSAGMSTTAAA